MTNTNFIGRTNELKKLEDIFNFRHDGEQQDSPQWLSINGPHNIGKTYLVRNMMEKFEKNPIPNTYCVYFVVPRMKEFDPKRFWNALFSEIFETIPIKDEDLAAQSSSDMLFWAKNLKEARTFFSGDDCWSLEDKKYIHEVTKYVLRVFASYTKLGMYLILILDEFDAMRQSGTLESIDCFFKVSNKVADCAKYKNENLIFISRRTLKAIVEEYETTFHSNFSDIDTKTLHGFNDNDMEQYFNSYQKLPINVPNEDLKKLILYYCGKHPGLLIKCRERLRDQKDPVSQQKTMSKNSFVTDEYDRLIKLMRENKSMDAFFQAYIWQQYDENIDKELETMASDGFISKCEENAKNMYDWLGVEPQPYGVLKGYEPISLYFVEYMKINVRTEDLKKFSAILNNTEICIRKKIEEAMIKKYPKEYEKKIEDFVKMTSGKELFLQAYKLSVQANHANERGISWSPLDVLAFPDYAKIIQREWDIMKEFFLAYSNPGKLEQDFKYFLKDSRDIVCHRAARILLESKMCEAGDICNKILYSKVEKSFDSKDPATRLGVLIFYLKYQKVGWITSEFSFFDDFGKNEIPFTNVKFDDSENIDTRSFVYLVNYRQDNQGNIVSIDILEQFERKKNMQRILRCSPDKLNAILVDFSKPAERDQTIVI